MDDRRHKLSASTFTMFLSEITSLSGTLTYIKGLTHCLEATARQYEATMLLEPRGAVWNIQEAGFH